MAPAPAKNSRTVITLGLLVAAAMMMILNETSLAVALAPIMEDFSVSANTVQWLISGFMLTMAVVIPTSGFLLERWSTRRVFITALGLFVTGTLVAALAPAFGFLILGRIIQASGTAFIVPLLMTVTMQVVPPERRGTVMGLNSVVISVAPALGPTFGGFVIDTLSWHFIFWVVLPIMAAILALGVFFLPNVGTTRAVPLDVTSVALSALACGGLIYGLSAAERLLGGSPGPLVLTVAGAVALVVFVRRQLRLREAALMNVRLFALRNFRTCAVVTILSFGLLIATFTVLPIYLQVAVGLTAKYSGLAVLPGGVLQAILAPIVGRAYDSFGPRPLVIPGAVLLSAGLWGLATTPPVWGVVALHCVLSMGLVLVMTPLMTTALSSLAGASYAQGSAILTTLQQLAAAAGTAFLVVFLSRGTAQGLGAGLSLADATSRGAHLAFLFAGAASLVAIAFAWRVKRVNV